MAPGHNSNLPAPFGISGGYPGDISGEASEKHGRLNGIGRDDYDNV